jgi:hypothetical protein
MPAYGYARAVASIRATGRRAMSRFVFLLLIAVALPAGFAGEVAAQSGAPRYPLAADVESIDGIIRAFYEVASTPAGTLPNRARDASLHASDAQIRTIRLQPNGKAELEVLTLDELYARYYTSPSATPFYEREIHRVTHRFGNFAHVWSTYVASEAPDGAAIYRGISSVALYFDGNRWWITGWSDEKEREELPLPPEYVPPRHP